MIELNGLKFPGILEPIIGGVADIQELFLASANWRGVSLERAAKVGKLVPTQILEKGSFLDRLTSLWRYEYGEPFDLGRQVLYGSNTFHEADRLFDALNCALDRLNDWQLKNYLDRLADPNKHQDLLFEFIPIVRLDPSVGAEYEVAGYGEGNNTVDWLVRSQPTPLLLEVKNRKTDLIQSFGRLQRGERDPDGTAPAPTHDPALLLRSVESKFKKRDPSEMIQAIWIVTVLKQEEAELKAAFAKLDPQRVHVAILGHWEGEVYILDNDERAKRSVIATLRLSESPSSVFRRQT